MTLSQRAEQAGAGETRGLLEELFDVVHPVSMCWDFDQGEAHSLRRLPFDALLAINTDEAFDAAAQMLVPEGCGHSTHKPSAPDPDNLPSARLWGRLTGTTYSDAVTGLGTTTALARIAAIAKTKEQSDGRCYTSHTTCKGWYWAN